MGSVKEGTIYKAKYIAVIDQTWTQSVLTVSKCDLFADFVFTINVITYYGCRKL